MKKLLSLLLALVMCASLVACGGGEDDASEPDGAGGGTVYEPDDASGGDASEPDEAGGGDASEPAGSEDELTVEDVADRLNESYAAFSEISDKFHENEDAFQPEVIENMDAIGNMFVDFQELLEEAKTREDFPQEPLQGVLDWLDGTVAEWMETANQTYEAAIGS